MFLASPLRATSGLTRCFRPRPEPWDWGPCLSTLWAPRTRPLLSYRATCSRYFGLQSKWRSDQLQCTVDEIMLWKCGNESASLKKVSLVWSSQKFKFLMFLFSKKLSTAFDEQNRSKLFVFSISWRKIKSTFYVTVNNFFVCFCELECKLWLLLLPMVIKSE